MKKIYLLILVTLIFLGQGTEILAETSWPKLSVANKEEGQVIQLESNQGFKLKTLRQESSPSKLIFIFESETSWQPKELEVNNNAITRIDLKSTTPNEYSLEIQLRQDLAPDFELKNTTGNFRVIFPEVSTPTPTPTPSLENVVPTSTITQDFEVIPDSPSPTPTVTPKETATDNNQMTNPHPEAKQLTRMEFINVTDSENYLLLSFLPKPNFSFSLKEAGHYELVIPDFQLSGQHLRHKYYAPQNSVGFLSVRAEEIVSKDNSQLLIHIQVEPFYQLSFLPIPEGIKITPTPSTTN